MANTRKEYIGIGVIDGKYLVYNTYFENPNKPSVETHGYMSSADNIEELKKILMPTPNSERKIFPRRICIFFDAQDPNRVNDVNNCLKVLGDLFPKPDSDENPEAVPKLEYFVLVEMNSSRQDFNQYTTFNSTLILKINYDLTSSLSRSDLLTEDSIKKSTNDSAKASAQALAQQQTEIEPSSEKPETKDELSSEKSSVDFVKARSDLKEVCEGYLEHFDIKQVNYSMLEAFNNIRYSGDSALSERIYITENETQDSNLHSSIEKDDKQKFISHLNAIRNYIGLTAGKIHANAQPAGQQSPPPVLPEELSLNASSAELNKMLNAILKNCDYLKERSYPSRNFVAAIENNVSPLQQFIKVLAVQELKEDLENKQPTINVFVAKKEEDQARDAVNAFTNRIHQADFKAILEQNRQSSVERAFKWASVISILIGIGIIPSAILAAKRYHDSGGQSINFFSPLSKNLEDKAETIVQQTYKK